MTKPDDQRVYLGQAFRPASSLAIDAALEMRGDRAVLHDVTSGETLTECAVSALRGDSMPGTGTHSIRLPGHWLFQTDDGTVLEASNETSFMRRLRRTEGNFNRIYLVVAAVMLMGFVVWRWGIDLLAAGAVAMTPANVLDQMDQGTMRAMDIVETQPSELSEADRALVTDIFNRLIASMPEDERANYHLDFRSWPDAGPNAFALPGGMVVMTDALVNDHRDDPDLIAGVLGHEIGHVDEQHGLHQVYRSLSIYFLVAMMAGDVGPLLEDILLEGQLLLSLQHSRKAEYSADRFGLTLAEQAGFDPKGLIRFFEALEAYDLDSDWYSTHPLSADRVQEAYEHLDRLQ